MKGKETSEEARSPILKFKTTVSQKNSRPHRSRPFSSHTNVDTLSDTKQEMLERSNSFFTSQTQGTRNAAFKPSLAAAADTEQRNSLVAKNAGQKGHTRQPILYYQYENQTNGDTSQDESIAYRMRSLNQI